MTMDGQPTAREMLAENLKELRAASGMSVRALAEKMGWDHSHLHRMESGRSRGSEELIDALVTFYEAPYLKRFWTLARQTPITEQYDKYLRLQSKARVMYQYAPSIVPGLLQTRAYARELLQVSEVFGDDLDEQVERRLDRQAILTAEDRAEYRAIIDEAALRCPLSDREEWHEQLAHLVEMAKLPNVTIHVLPQAAGLHGLTNTHTMLMRQPKGTSVGYAETGQSGELIEDPKEVDRLHVLYDRLRDKALSPRESVAFIEQLMEESSCEPSGT